MISRWNCWRMIMNSRWAYIVIILLLRWRNDFLVHWRLPTLLFFINFIINMLITRFLMTILLESNLELSYFLFNWFEAILLKTFYILIKIFSWRITKFLSILIIFILPFGIYWRRWFMLNRYFQSLFLSEFLKFIPICGLNVLREWSLSFFSRWIVNIIIH